MSQESFSLFYHSTVANFIVCDDALLALGTFMGAKQILLLFTVFVFLLLPLCRFFMLGSCFVVRFLLSSLY